jgi:hypothetical protein
VSEPGNEKSFEQRAFTFILNPLTTDLPLPAEIIPGHKLRRATLPEAQKIIEFVFTGGFSPVKAYHYTGGQMPLSSLSEEEVAAWHFFVFESVSNFDGGGICERGRQTLTHPTPRRTAASGRSESLLTQQAPSFDNRLQKGNQLRRSVEHSGGAFFEAQELGTCRLHSEAGKSTPGCARGPGMMGCSPPQMIDGWSAEASKCPVFRIADRTTGPRSEKVAVEWSVLRKSLKNMQHLPLPSRANFC